MNTQARQVVLDNPFRVDPAYITQNLEADIGASMYEAAKGEGGRNLHHSKCGSVVTGLSKRQLEVLAVLTDMPQKTKDIADALGMTNDLAGYNLTVLRRDGKAERSKYPGCRCVYWVRT